MKTELIALRGKLYTKPFQLEGGQRVIIGRGDDADVHILDAGLSRHHCYLERVEDTFTLGDMESRNGTWVNGKRITTAELKHGDKVKLGAIEFEFRAEPERRRKEANLIASYPEGIGTEFKERLALDKTDLMRLPKEFQNVENFRRVQRDLSTIYKVGNLINAEEVPERLFSHVMDTIFDVTGADRGYLLVESDDRGKLKTVVMRRRPGVEAQLSSTFSSTVVDECFKTGVSIIRSDLAKDDHFGTAESVIMQNIHSVMCVPVETLDRPLGVIYVDSLAEARAFTKHELELLGAIGKQAGIAIQRIRLLKQIRQLFHGTVQALVATIEAKDVYTRGHSQRVTEYALDIAQAMHMAHEAVTAIELAGYLHDVGKIGVAEHILNKPRQLSDEEYEIIKRHPEVGATIIRNIRRAAPIASIVRHHHERWDGDGYPDGLSGERIPLLARVLAVADAFDAMTSKRPYRDRLPTSKALGELEAMSGSQFDPQIASVMIDLVQSGKVQPPEAEPAEPQPEEQS